MCSPVTSKESLIPLCDESSSRGLVPEHRLLGDDCVPQHLVAFAVINLRFNNLLRLLRRSTAYEHVATSPCTADVIENLR